MKIINRSDFLKCSSGILFSYYEPILISGLMIKGDTWEDDFLYVSIKDSIDVDDEYNYRDILENAEKEKTSIPVDFDIYDREGLFEKDQLFVIWEKSDVEKLIKKLSECLEG